MNRPTIIIEPEKPDTLRISSLQFGESFLYEENLYLKVHPGGSPEPTVGPLNYCTSVRLITGHLMQLRDDVCVTPVALSIRAARLRVVGPQFPGLDGPS